MKSSSLAGSFHERIYKTGVCLIFEQSAYIPQCLLMQLISMLCLLLHSAHCTLAVSKFHQLKNKGFLSWH